MSRRAQNAKAVSFGVSSESIQNIRTVRSFANEDKEADRYRLSNEVFIRRHCGPVIFEGDHNVLRVRRIGATRPTLASPWASSLVPCLSFNIYIVDPMYLSE